MDRKLANLVKGFWNKSVLIVGDVMLDKTVYGSVSRISPEAPVGVHKVEREEYTLGGAGNTAANLGALGANVFLIGVMGNDDHARQLMQAFRGVMVNACMIPDKRPTTTKMRLVAQHGYQLVRADYETAQPIGNGIESKIAGMLKRRKADAIVVSDYAKGTITQRVYDAALRAAEARGIPLLVDAKPASKVHYGCATVVKFNHKEACEYLGTKEQNGDGIRHIGEKLVHVLGSNVVVTRAEEGVSVFTKDGKYSAIPTYARQVADVSGAGDTFVAALAMGYLAGKGSERERLENAVRVGNFAAGIKCGKRGAVPVSRKELQDGLRHD